MPVLEFSKQSEKAYLTQDDLANSFSYGKRSHAVSAERALVDAMKNDFLENMVQYMPGQF